MIQPKPLTSTHELFLYIRVNLYIGDEICRSNGKSLEDKRMVKNPYQINS